MYGGEKGESSLGRQPHPTNRVYHFRDTSKEVEEEEGILDEDETSSTQLTKQSKTKLKKKVVLTVNVNPRVIATRKFDSNDIRIIRAARETSQQKEEEEEEDVIETNNSNVSEKPLPYGEISKSVVTAAAVTATAFEARGQKRRGDTNYSNNDGDNPKSVQRLLKAQRLLTMAQITPSQRLERMQQSSQSVMAGAGSGTGLIGMEDTVVPMGSYSMRFGGYGSLEEEIENQQILLPPIELRMADTFDSVDNMVDSKSSLLPGRRWVNNSKQVTSSRSSSSLGGDGQRQHRTTLSSSSTKSAFLSNQYYKPPGVGEVGYTNIVLSTTPPSITSSSLPGEGGGGGGGQVATPLIQYDPVAAERLLFNQPTKWLARNVQIALPLGLWVCGVVLDVVLGKEVVHRTRRARELNLIIGNLGPAIIKAGQALASRPDLLPGEYLEELQKLQDDVPTFGNDIAFRIVEEELKQKFVDVFELIEPEPVAAASIGQVYKGRLKSNGQTVAIKIQRPKTEEIIALDLYVLRWWGGVYNGIFRLFGRDIDLQNVMDDFGTLLYGEIDYVAEAANARRFSELYAEEAITDVFVPKVYSELTTRKVLTMEWVDGFRLTDSESLEANNLDRKKLVDTLVQCSLRQIMGSGFFHADPHAGNLLATCDGRLCYLDFGMMSYADVAQRNGFLLAIVHIVNRDWGELVRVYQRLGFIPEGTDSKPIELALEQALPDVLSADISELNFKNVVGKLGDIMYKFPFSLPPFYISIIRCLGVLEGLAIQVDPKSRIISDAYPYVANRVLTDDSQEELREALRRLIITADGHIRWSRLESLLDEAKESSGFDIVPAASKLIDFVISNEGGDLLDDIADQIVFEADSLGRDTVLYITRALGVLVKPDGPVAAKVLRALVEHLQTEQEAGNDLPSSVTTAMSKFLSSIMDTLPEPSPSIQRTMKIGRVLGTREASTLSSSSSSKIAGADTVDAINKFVPLLRKLSQEPKITNKASEVVARLGERAMSRGLRFMFGLPPPVYEAINSDKVK